MPFDGGGGGGLGSLTNVGSGAADLIGNNTSSVNALGAGLASVGLSVYETERAGQFAADQRGWQEGLANTAYQRSMLDMKQAGLNPILAYKQGSATTPGGAMARPANMGNIVSTALQGARLSADISQVKQKTKEMKAGEGKLKTGQLVDKMLADKFKQETATSASQMKRTEIEAALAATMLPGANAEMRIDQSWYGQMLRYMNRFSNSVVGAARAAVTGKAVGTGATK